MTNAAPFLSEHDEELALMIQEAKSDILTFSQLLDPRFEVAWFHQIIANALERAFDAVQNGRKARIILTLPPRHGKSTLVSHNFPAWVLGKDPRSKFILTTYGAELSEKNGQKARDLILDPRYQIIFPEIELRQDSKAKAKWMTKQGGEFLATGIGGAVTGFGANYILIDDPHKDRAEAESEVMRENVIEYYKSTLYSRLEGYGCVILIMQRWHIADLVGYVLEESESKKKQGLPHDEWEVINFPAIAEEDEYHDSRLVRRAGEALWPSKFPLPVLNNIREQSQVYNWASQYMQDPILAETQEFKTSMFRYYDEEDLKHKYLRYYTLIDPAISQKQEADNTVVLTIGKEVYGPNIYRIREDAGHFTPGETIDLIFKHQKEYRSDVHLETVAYQLALKFNIEEEQSKRNQYFIVNEIKTRTNKEVRIRGLLAPYERGVIFHRHADVEYERELLHFPNGKHDDRADAMSMCLESLVSTPASGARQFKPAWKGYGRKA